MLASVTTSAQTLYAATSGLTGNYPNRRGITLIAPSTNTGNVHFGNSSGVTSSGATTAGLFLAPGQSVTIHPSFAADAKNLYVISSTGTQNLIWDTDQNPS